MAVEVAVEAARFVAESTARLSISRADGGVEVAAKTTTTDLVTDVDRASEALLIEAIGRRRPHDAVLGEESGRHPGAGGSAVEWVIDPIDGTVNFVLGIPLFSVSVAARRDGVVLAGCVADVMRGEVFYARAERGSRVRAADGSDRALVGPRAVTLTDAVVGTGFGYEPQVRRRQGAVLAELLPLVGNVRRLGSAALDLCYVAAGRLDAYYESGLNDWDRAAGLLIAAQAGAQVGTLEAPAGGRPTTIAAAPSVFSSLRALLVGIGAA